MLYIVLAQYVRYKPSQLYLEANAITVWCAADWNTLYSKKNHTHTNACVKLSVSARVVSMISAHMFRLCVVKNRHWKWCDIYREPQLGVWELRCAFAHSLVGFSFHLFPYRLPAGSVATIKPANRHVSNVSAFEDCGVHYTCNVWVLKCSCFYRFGQRFGFGMCVYIFQLPFRIFEYVLAAQLGIIWRWIRTHTFILFNCCTLSHMQRRCHRNTKGVYSCSNIYNEILKYYLSTQSLTHQHIMSLLCDHLFSYVCCAFVRVCCLCETIADSYPHWMSCVCLYNYFTCHQYE